MKVLVTFVEFSQIQQRLLTFARETKDEKKNCTFVEHLLGPHPSTSARHSRLRTRMRGEQATEAQTGSTAVCRPLTSVQLPNPVYGVSMVRRPLALLLSLEVATVKPAQRCPVTSLVFPPEQFRPLPSFPLTHQDPDLLVKPHGSSQDSVML